MKKLIYVPVIHSSADLGSIGADVARRGATDLGEDIWARHRQTVAGFWEALTHYFDSLNVSGMKIYQDGMVADGAVGVKIIEETARTGSQNYELLAALLKRGAVLMKTEDFSLAKEERDRLLAITNAGSLTGKLLGYLKYKLTKGGLLKRRDRFIAGRINETLNSGETGILFIGAFHNTKNMLSAEIEVTELKETEKVKLYQKLLPFSHKRPKLHEELGVYLVSPIEVPAPPANRDEEGAENADTYGDLRAGL